MIVHTNAVLSCSVPAELLESIAGWHPQIGERLGGVEDHQGWINYLACHPDRRRTGIATELMTAARELLLDRGSPKINLQVRSGNQEAREFYESLGYSEDSVTSFGLRLIPDS